MPPFVLVDGSYFLFRAYHALPPLTTSTGLQTNAIRGAISAIQKLMRRVQPTHMAVIFDTPEPTFRHELSPIYKGDRPSMPSELLRANSLSARIDQSLRNSTTRPARRRSR